MITLIDFKSDTQGKTFSDVISDKRVNFQDVIDFFNDKRRLERMEDSEIHHERPALAGVIKEFEKRFNVFLSSQPIQSTFRFRQAVGVLVRLHMESRGWKKTGIKGSLGTKGNKKTNSIRPGISINKHGLAKWFTKSERYVN